MVKFWYVNRRAPCLFPRTVCPAGDHCRGADKLNCLLPLWERIPAIRRCYIRLLSPSGDVHDVWQNNLESTLEALDTHHQIFRSQKRWGMFLESQREIADEWDLRVTFTASDRVFLAELKVAWEPKTMRHARWRASHGHDDDFLNEIGAAHWGIQQVLTKRGESDSPRLFSLRSPFSSTHHNSHDPGMTLSRTNIRTPVLGPAVPDSNNSTNYFVVSVFSAIWGICFSLKAEPNGMKTSDTGARLLAPTLQSRCLPKGPQTAICGQGKLLLSGK